MLFDPLETLKTESLCFFGIIQQVKSLLLVEELRDTHALDGKSHGAFTGFDLLESYPFVLLKFFQSVCRCFTGCFQLFDLFVHGLTFSIAIHFYFRHIITPGLVVLYLGLFPRQQWHYHWTRLSALVYASAVLFRVRVLFILYS